MENHNFNSAAFISLLFGVTLLLACNQGSTQKQKTSAGAYSSKTCYMAVDKADTVLLNITKKGSVVEGTLVFHYANETIFKGTFKGLMPGDTLIADYSFKADNGKYYRNPVAFLQKNEELTLGVGVMENAWGRNYFSRTIPINYEKGRFTFRKVSCEKQTRGMIY